MPDATQEAHHWRILAARATAAAAQTAALNARMDMLRIALGYEQLARQAERRVAIATDSRTAYREASDPVDA
jgi:hypothetical protein